MSNGSMHRLLLAGNNATHREKSAPTGQVILTQNSKEAYYVCHAYGVAMSGINWEKLL
jgi:hypothetical protein